MNECVCVCGRERGREIKVLTLTDPLENGLLNTGRSLGSGLGSNLSLNTVVGHCCLRGDWGCCSSIYDNRG